MTSITRRMILIFVSMTCSSCTILGKNEWIPAESFALQDSLEIHISLNDTLFYYDSLQELYTFDSAWFGIILKPRESAVNKNWARPSISITVHNRSTRELTVPKSGFLIGSALQLSSRNKYDPEIEYVVTSEDSTTDSYHVNRPPGLHVDRGSRMNKDDFVILPSGESVTILEGFEFLNFLSVSALSKGTFSVQANLKNLWTDNSFTSMWTGVAISESATYRIK